MKLLSFSRFQNNYTIHSSEYQMNYDSFIQVLSVTLIFPMLFFNLHYQKAYHYIDSLHEDVKGNTPKVNKRKCEIRRFANITWLIQVVFPTTVILIPNILIFCKLLSTSYLTFENIDYFRTFYCFLALFLIFFEGLIVTIYFRILLAIKKI